jgi:hypothetical protein
MLPSLFVWDVLENSSRAALHSTAFKQIFHQEIRASRVLGRQLTFTLKIMYWFNLKNTGVCRQAYLALKFCRPGPCSARGFYYLGGRQVICIFANRGKMVSGKGWAWDLQATFCKTSKV